LKFVKVD